MPAYVTSLGLLRAAAAKTPTQDALADVADTSLDLANVYVSLGDTAGTRATFAQANAFGDHLNPRGMYAGLKAQRQGAHARRPPSPSRSPKQVTASPMLSVAPWTGPDLPGSVASTLKYRLIVAAASDANDHPARAHGLAPGLGGVVLRRRVVLARQPKNLVSRTAERREDVRVSTRSAGHRRAPRRRNDQRCRRQHRHRSDPAH